MIAIIGACLLLLGGVASLPLNVRENAPLFSEDLTQREQSELRYPFATQEEPSEFRPPSAMAALEKLTQKEPGEFRHPSKMAALELRRIRGSKIKLSQSSHQPNALKGRHQLFDSGVAETKPVSLHMSALSRAKGAKTRLVLFIVMVIVVMVGLFFACSLMEESEESEETTIPSKDDITPKEDTQIGTWALTYQKADEQSKQGLDLLLGCNIIPQEEFDKSQVSQEHIDECVWIAIHMLQQRPLEQWIQMRPEAQKTFMDRNQLCLSSNEKEPGGTPKASVQHLEYPEHTPECDDRAIAMRLQADNMTAPSESEVHSVRSEKSYTTSVKSSVSGVPSIFKHPEDSNSLILRCRQIMTASDSKRKPWDSNYTPPASQKNVQDLDGNVSRVVGEPGGAAVPKTWPSLGGVAPARPPQTVGAESEA